MTTVVYSNNHLYTDTKRTYIGANNNLDITVSLAKLFGEDERYRKIFDTFIDNIDIKPKWVELNSPFFINGDLISSFGYAGEGITIPYIASLMDKYNNLTDIVDELVEIANLFCSNNEVHSGLLCVGVNYTYILIISPNGCILHQYPKDVELCIGSGNRNAFYSIHDMLYFVVDTNNDSKGYILESAKVDPYTNNEICILNTFK